MRWNMLRMERTMPGLLGILAPVSASLLVVFVGPESAGAGEISKISEGRIHMIEASGTVLPHGSKSGWE